MSASGSREGVDANTPLPPRTKTASAPAAVAQRFLGNPGAGILIFLLMLLAVMGIAIPQFLAFSNLYVIANQTVFILLPTLGMTLVIIAGGIDLSVGSVLGLCGGVAAALVGSGMSMVLAFFIAIACGGVIGAINGLVITRLNIPDFVATLAMLGVARGILYVWTQGVPMLNYMSNLFYTIGGLNHLLLRLTVPLVVAIVLLVVLAFILRRTSFGVHLRATGSNASAAALSGIGVRKIKVVTYIVSGMLAGVTGILLAGRLTTVHPDMGSGYELQAVAAAVMGGAVLSGGRGSFYGALIGAVTLTVIQNVINILNLDSNWQDVVVGVIIIAAVLIDRGALRLSGQRS